MAFLDQKGIASLGFAKVGRSVRISDAARFYNPAGITIGDYSRIDDFCILSAGSGGIGLGRFIHIGCYSSIIGEGAVILGDYSGLSSRVAIYSSSDDFSGIGMAHPTVPADLRKVEVGDVLLARHVLIGAGSVLLPGIRLEEGVSVGALSLVASDLEAFGRYAGVPVRKIGQRHRNLLALGEELERRVIAGGMPGD
ncbi:MAG: acyltransferase [Betaproteobacteria bacterium]|nr:acyltransferase [Betaproteobacteria bacterium]